MKGWCKRMMYPFMTLPDDTEIVHSQTLLINGKEQVKVYMEKPIHMGFNTEHVIYQIINGRAYMALQKRKWIICETLSNQLHT